MSEKEAGEEAVLVILCVVGFHVNMTQLESPVRREPQLRRRLLLDSL